MPSGASSGPFLLGTECSFLYLEKISVVSIPNRRVPLVSLSPLDEIFESRGFSAFHFSSNEAFQRRQSFNSVRIVICDRRRPDIRRMRHEGSYGLWRLVRLGNDRESAPEQLDGTHR